MLAGYAIPQVSNKEVQKTGANGSLSSYYPLGLANREELEEYAYPDPFSESIQYLYNIKVLKRLTNVSIMGSCL